MKSYETKPGKGVPEEAEQAAEDTLDAENPTEIIRSEIEQTEAANGMAQTEAEQLLEPTVVPEQDDPPTVVKDASSLVTLGQTSTSPRAFGQISPGTVMPEEAPVSPPQASPGQSFKLSSAPPGRSFKWPTREQLLNGLPFWAVFLLGAVLRFWDLGGKPLHHDESLHAYYALGLLHNLQHWGWCVGLNNPPAGYTCYQYDPLLHGPFQFHAIALVYQISQWLGAPDNGVNTTTVRIMAALLGSLLVILPFFLRDYMGKLGAWLGCLLLAVSPSMVYFSRFAREDIYMACFTLLMVVSVARYVRDRKMRWLVLAAAGFALSYATSEATFLTIAVFGSFMGALLVWEVGSKFRLRSQQAASQGSQASRFVPRTYAPFVVLAYFLLAGIAAKIALAKMDQLSTYINAHTAVTDVQLLNLETNTVKVIPWLGILLGLYVFWILIREIYGNLPTSGRRGLARYVDRRQPLLDTILTMSWTHWFFSLLLGFGIFLLLFTVVFTNLKGGIGDGIWKGLYYWLEQQNVHRGDEPWYYYLLLIPLYEQIGVVFGIVGIIRCLWKPNQFRLFLVYWFLGDFFIYSWAGEKMPWLMIFMTMPLMLLAALGLEPCVMACYRFAKERFFSPAQPHNVLTDGQVAPVAPSHPRIGAGRAALGLFGVVMAVLLFLPTIHNMVEVSYVEPADGPHEMMIYVQTTTDVNIVMAKIDEVNQKDFHGDHQMRIGVTGDATWPFAWYLRDYPNLCFGYPTCPGWKTPPPVIIAGGDDPYGDINSYAPAKGNFLYHEYNMRSWWDQGYMLPPCTGKEKPSMSCADPTGSTGVGPLLWLSYGDNPPPGAKFNLGLTIQRVWNWWWYRQPFGATNGAYNMELFIQKGLGVNP